MSKPDNKDALGKFNDLKTYFLSFKKRGRRPLNNPSLNTIQPTIKDNSIEPTPKLKQNLAKAKILRRVEFKPGKISDPSKWEKPVPHLPPEQQKESRRSC